MVSATPISAHAAARWQELAARQTTTVAARIFVRHAKSKYNVLAQPGNESSTDPELEQHTREELFDAPLVAEGVKQADVVGEFIRSHLSFMLTRGRYRHSQFQRARHTAERLKLSTEWVPSSDLGERDWGTFNGLSWAELEQRYPDQFLALQRDPVNTTPPGGESFGDVQVRARRFLGETSHHVGETVVAVAHGDFLKTLRFVQEEMSLEDFRSMIHSKEPHHQMNNGQVVAYTSVHPITFEVAPNLRWYLSVCPWKKNPGELVWREVQRRKA